MKRLLRISTFKKTFIATILLFLFFFLLLPCSARGGHTDANGGHYNNSTGEYHYHHGYPAHQHTGGKCPYNFDDQTGQSSGGSSSGSNSNSDSTYKPPSDGVATPSTPRRQITAVPTSVG